MISGAKNNYALRKADKNGYLDIVKYLHKPVGLNRNDFMSTDNYVMKTAIDNNDNKIIDYVAHVLFK